jgi:hypothetical protein
MNRRILRFPHTLALMVVSLLVSACVVVPVGRPGGAPARVVVADLNVPPGHLPRRGQCRLWYPGRPPGRQPRAADCSYVMRNAPAGAWVLYRANDDHVHRRTIDSRRSGVVVSVHVFMSATGKYVRDGE